MSIFEVFGMIGQNVWLYGGAFILVLSILVFVHEWGHYIVARMCGVKVETFSIGFGKELFGLTDKKGTRWKFAMIPLGGYVKLFGDVDPASAGHTDNVEDGEETRPMTEAERKQAFFAKPVWKRAAVVFAGPAINYIFAIIILTGLFTFNGEPVTPPVAAAVIEGSAADENGFMTHDEIVSIDGKRIESFEDIRREMMIALDTEKHFVVKRGEREIDIYASPEKITQTDRFGFQHSRGLLGLISPRNAIQVDTIQAVDGRRYDDADAIRDALVSKFGSDFEITIPYGEETQTLRIRPSENANEGLFAGGDHMEANILFVALSQDNYFVQYPIGRAVIEAVNESWIVTVGTIEALGQMIMGTRSAAELGGIIRIGALAGDMAQQGIIALILFSALLSINLGLINLFPIPMLDGGHLVFYAFEAVLGKPVPEKFQEYAFRVGFVFLIGLMAFANLNDLVQLFISGAGS